MADRAILIALQRAAILAIRAIEPDLLDGSLSISEAVSQIAGELFEVEGSEGVEGEEIIDIIRIAIASRG